jgi:hypothetical protein
MDNDHAVWQAYANRYWPTRYLIDQGGTIRQRWIGEGGYAQTERAIQALLRPTVVAAEFPEPVEPMRQEDLPGAASVPTTPELHYSALGNPETPTRTPVHFQPPVERCDGRFYLEGLWKHSLEGLTLAGEEGAILLPYQAASVNAVLAASPEPEERALRLHPPVEVELTQDTLPLHPDSFAEDVYQASGQARLRVDLPRMYALVRNPDVESHELRLHAFGAGLTIYAFSFGSCARPTEAVESRRSRFRIQPPTPE